MWVDEHTCRALAGCSSDARRDLGQEPSGKVDWEVGVASWMKTDAVEGHRDPEFRHASLMQGSIYFLKTFL